MKKILFEVALSFITIGCFAEQKQALTLQMESGARIVYFLDAKPEIGFKGQNMTVSVDEETTEIPMVDVDRWEIGMAEYDDIEPITAYGTLGLMIDGRSLTVSNPSATTVSIYQLNGELVGASDEPKASFSLPAGIYVVTNAKKSYKIAIR